MWLSRLFKKKEKQDKKAEYRYLVNDSEVPEAYFKNELMQMTMGRVTVKDLKEDIGREHRCTCYCSFRKEIGKKSKCAVEEFKKFRIEVK